MATKPTEGSIYESTKGQAKQRFLVEYVSEDDEEIGDFWTICVVDTDKANDPMEPAYELDCDEWEDFVNKLGLVLTSDA